MQCSVERLPFVSFVERLFLLSALGDVLVTRDYRATRRSADHIGRRPHHERAVIFSLVDTFNRPARPLVGPTIDRRLVAFPMLGRASHCSPPTRRRNTRAFSQPPDSRKESLRRGWLASHRAAWCRAWPGRVVAGSARPVLWRSGFVVILPWLVATWRRESPHSSRPFEDYR